MPYHLFETIGDQPVAPSKYDGVTVNRHYPYLSSTGKVNSCRKEFGWQGTQSAAIAQAVTGAPLVGFFGLPRSRGQHYRRPVCCFSCLKKRRGMQTVEAIQVAPIFESIGCGKPQPDGLYFPEGAEPRYLKLTTTEEDHCGETFMPASIGPRTLFLCEGCASKHGIVW